MAGSCAGGGETTNPPSIVTWNTGVVLQTITPNTRYLILTPTTGVADVTVSFGGTKTWYWGVARQGRVQYSSQLRFY